MPGTVSLARTPRRPVPPMMKGLRLVAIEGGRQGRVDAAGSAVYAVVWRSREDPVPGSRKGLIGRRPGNGILDRATTPNVSPPASRDQPLSASTLASHA